MHQIPNQNIKKLEEYCVNQILPIEQNVLMKEGRREVLRVLAIKI